MGKKKHNTCPKQTAEQARANAQKFYDAFTQLGLNCTMYEDTPSWMPDAKEKPAVISVVKLDDFYDSEDYPYEFIFSHETGRLIK